MASLTVNPASNISFTLSRSDTAATKSTLTLTAPANADTNFCFKVKTTQPRRYLVRPNQGLVAPGTSESVTIILVDKDKQILLNEFEQIGPPALESSKDKFLIQSCEVTEEFYNDTHNKGAKEVAEALTNQLLCSLMYVVPQWSKKQVEFKAQQDAKADAKKGSGDNRVLASPDLITSKKLQVKHTVDTASLSTGGAGNAAGGYGSVQAGAERIREGLSGGGEGEVSPEQFSDNSALRKKYDELVAFSVTLTAERDILNNALEQAKRDLNREMAARMSAEDSALKAPSGLKRGGGGGGVESKAVKAGFTFFQVLVMMIIAFFAGKFINGATSLADLGNVVGRGAAGASGGEM